MALFFTTLLLLFSSPVWGAWHLYVTPVLDRHGGGLTSPNRVPKYIGEMKGVRFRASYFGEQAYCLVAADVDDLTDAALIAEPDVVKLPDNLDQTLGAGLATVQKLLEARSIPAGWLTSNTTYRTLVKTVIGIFAFAQRYPVTNKVHQAFLAGQVTLDTQFNQLGTTAQQRLLAAAKSLKLDTSGLSGTSTMRQILKSVSDQWIARQGGIQLGGITIAEVSYGERIRRALLKLGTQSVAWAATFTDNFNRANANPISGPWTVVSNPLQIINNRIRGVSGGNGLMMYTGFSPAPDQSVQVALPSLGTTVFGAVVLRMDSQGSGYYLGCTTDSVSVIFAYSPTFNFLAQDPTPCVQGNTIKGIASGTDLEFQIDGVQIVPASDAALSSGNCGLYLEYSPAVTDIEMDDFVCADTSGVGVRHRSGWR